MFKLEQKKVLTYNEIFVVKDEPFVLKFYNFSFVYLECLQRTS
jgi:hypothetical protein